MKTAEEGRTEGNVGWLRLRALEARENDLDEMARNELKQELGLVVMEASRTKSPISELVPASSIFSKKKSLLVVCITVGLFAGVTYAFLGNYDLVSLSNSDDVLVLSAEVDRVALESHFTNLKSRVKNEPSDSKSAYLLGHAALKLEDYETASRAFESVDRAAQGDKNVKFFLLQAKLLEKAGVFDDQIERIIRELLPLASNDPTILKSLGILFIQSGQVKKAISALSILANVELDLDRQPKLLESIAILRSDLASKEPSVTVNVSVDLEMYEDKWIFVMARPPGGGMPYAVARRPAGLSPLSVVLDDFVSMTPDRNLSSASSFEVAVFISDTGAVSDRVGEWSWVSSQLSKEAIVDGLVFDVDLRQGSQDLGKTLSKSILID
tara:strand:+ start:229 stop:1377 length:1149 start_codon:yes stop_codon:yes gene_type:complete